MMWRPCASSSRARAKTSKAPSLESRDIAADGRIALTSITSTPSALRREVLVEVLREDAARDGRSDLGAVAAGPLHIDGERDRRTIARRVCDEPGRVGSAAAVGLDGPGFSAKREPRDRQAVGRAAGVGDLVH